MVDHVIQFLSASLLFLGLWLMGDKRLLGPFIVVIAELFVVVVGVMHGTWAIVVIGIGLTLIQGRNFIKWRSEGIKW